MILTSGKAGSIDEERLQCRSKRFQIHCSPDFPVKRQRYEHGTITFISQVIIENCTRATTLEHSKALGLVEQGTSSLQRYETAGALADLEEAIIALSNGNESIPDNHPTKTTCLGSLGISFICRFQRLDRLADVDEAIMAMRQAVRLAPDGHPDKPQCLDDLGTFFLHRFKRLGALDGHPDKPVYLNDLGTSFLCQFERLDDLVGLDEAITVQQQVTHGSLCISATSGPPYFVGSSVWVALPTLMTQSRLSTRQSVSAQMVTPASLCISITSGPPSFGGSSAWMTSITALQQARRLTPDGHPEKPVFLNYLGTSFPFLRSFERLGDLVDLDEAITALQRAIRLTPDGHPRKPRCLSNLETSFLRRSERLVTLSISIRLSRLISRPSVLPQMVTLTNLSISMTSETPSFVGLSV
jgi:tetratricopeptide (TPR) repeat protein